MVIPTLRAICVTFAVTCTTANAEPMVLGSPSRAVSENGTLVENIGIETLGGVFTPLLKTGCQTPCSTTQVFSTADDRQTEIKLRIYSGSAGLTRKAKKIAAVAIVGIPPEPRGTPQIAVTFSVANKQILLGAIDKNTNLPLEIKRHGF